MTFGNPACAAMLRMQGSINQLLVEAFAEESKDELTQAALLDTSTAAPQGNRR